MVGTAGFEPTTPCTPSKCATRLRYVPNRKRPYSGLKTSLAQGGRFRVKESRKATQPGAGRAANFSAVG